MSGIQLAIRNSRNLLGSLTCRKAGTWDRFFYFPSGGRHAEDFYGRKNPTASARFEPANVGARGQHANHQITEAVQTHTKNSSNYCFSIATMVARTCPNISLYVHCLSCFILDSVLMKQEQATKLCDVTRDYDECEEGCLQGQRG